MRRILSLLALATLSCGPRYPKQAPVDFAALAGPSAANFSSEADLLSNWRRALEPAWNTGRDGELVAQGGVRVHFHVTASVGPAKGAVVVVPGRTEPAIKYAELAADLAPKGYAVYVLDLRGQGTSQRLLPDPEKGYVEFFEDYVADLDQLVREVVLPDGAPRLFILAHSMGGLVAALWADEHPETPAAMALSAPMFEIDTGGFPSAVAFTLASTDCSITDGSAYAAGQKPFTLETDFATSDVTHSEPRWRWKVDLYADHPELRLGGATYRWLCESLVAGAYGQKLGAASQVPTLIFQAGEDTVVKPGGQARYCDAAARCQITRFEDARHEIFQDIDAVRNEALSQAVKLFELVGGAP